jgi:hypothetical protein
MSIVSTIYAGHVLAGREAIAVLAERDGENIFAGEVRAGCWDHRRDIKLAIARAIEAEQFQ